MRDPDKMRHSFPSGERLPLKYKLLSKVVSVPDTTYNAVILDLSSEGARLQGSLEEKLVFDLGGGNIQMGCNIILNDKILKLLATVRWFKQLSPGEFEFGVEFDLSDEVRLEIQRFLIRHQIDTRRFKRKFN